MNDIDFCLEVTSTIALHLTLNISETARDRDNRKWHGVLNGHVTDDVKSPPKVQYGRLS